MGDSAKIAELNRRAAERAKKGLPWKPRRVAVAWKADENH